MHPMDHQPRHIKHSHKPKKGFDWMIVVIGLMILAVASIIYFGQGQGLGY